MMRWIKQLIRWHKKPIHKLLEENQSKRKVLIDFKLEPEIKEF